MRFTEVEFSYGDGNDIIKNLNVHIRPGEIVLLKGKSGTGKSTFLRLLSGSFKNYKGAILINDIPIGNYDLSSIRKNTGILLGNQDIFNGTILQNLTMGNPDINFDQVLYLTHLTGLNNYIGSCKEGYDTLLKLIGINIPIVVRKNILLVRALLGDNRLLLLKEPFDHLSKQQIPDIINYIRQTGATAIIASRKGIIKEYCDKVFLIANCTISKSLK